MSANPYSAGSGGPANFSNNEQPWRRWQDWVNLVLGVWLFIAPWIWHSTTAASASGTSSGWNAWILGVIVALVALWALSSPASTTPEWINAIAGIWLFIAPFVMGYHRVSASSAWNQWSVGLIVFVLAIWSLSATGGAHGRTGGAHTA